MRQFLQKILTPIIAKLAHKYDGKPDKQRVFEKLTELHQNILDNPGKKGLIMPFNSSYFQTNIKEQKIFLTILH